MPIKKVFSAPRLEICRSIARLPITLSKVLMDITVFEWKILVHVTRMLTNFVPPKVAECDLFVLIVGHLYGGYPKGSETSYTEREYNTAAGASVYQYSYSSRLKTFL